MEDADFQELFRRHGDRLYNFAFRLSGNDQDAADLVQEAFTRAFKNLDRYDRARPFETWMFRILYNIHLDEVRRYEKKHVVSLDAPVTAEETGQWADLLAGGDPDPMEESLRRENDVRVQKALNTLSADYRAAVMMCDVEEMSYEEIARVMDCPVGTVRSRIHQGRTLLRDAFKEKEGVRTK
jgi:RNA polymerase sigma-70 factor (ECF subfamily)